MVFEFSKGSLSSKGTQLRQNSFNIIMGLFMVILSILLRLSDRLS